MGGHKKGALDAEGLKKEKRGPIEGGDDLGNLEQAG